MDGKPRSNIRFFAALVVALALTACGAGPATDADIQRMKDEGAAEIGDLATFKSSMRQEARNRGESWENIEAVAEILDYEAYRLCSLALLEWAIDEAVATHSGATVKELDQVSIGVVESPAYQDKQWDCLETSLNWKEGYGPTSPD